MNWQEILTIVVPIFGFMAWSLSRIDKKFDAIDKKFEFLERKMDEGFKELKNEIQDIRKDLQTLDSRVARIEGHLTGLYHFEARQGKKTGTEDKR